MAPTTASRVLPNIWLIFERAIEFIEIADFLKAHLNGNIIQLVAVHHFAAHFGQKPFFFIGVFFKKKIGDDCAEDSVAQIFQPFIILIGSFFNRAVGEGCFIKDGFARQKPQYIAQLFPERN